MPLFKFKAQKPSGEVYEGTREAVDKFVLYHEIKAEGDVVVTADEAKRKKGLDLSFLLRILNRVSTKDKIVFARNLGSMLEAGLPISKALSVIERQNNKPGFKEVIKKLLEEINKGQSLSESLKKFPGVFSPLFVSMTMAGEESGSLPSALKNISEQMNRMYSLQKKVKGALIYPAIIVCIMVVIAIAMLIYVVPSITAIFEDIDADLPLSTQILISSSKLLTENSLLALFCAATLLILAYLFYRSKTGKRIFDDLYLKMPVIRGLIIEVNAARTTRTMSSLLGAGVEVVEALEITKNVVQNHNFKGVLELAVDKIKKGGAVSSVFLADERFFPVFVGEMMAIGEETGQLAQTLGNVAAYYEDDVDQKTKNLSTIIEPFLMIVIGLAVVFFALSILGPIYSLADKLGI